MEIEFDSFTPVAGFQFDVTGTQLYNAAGGLAAEAGFTVSVGGNTVIGFSLQGATIQGSGILTNLEYAAVASQACIDNVVLSDPAGNAMDYEVGGCVELDFEEPIFGCTDSSACNYDADANVDDGSCFYETECWDGSSECDPNDCPEPPSETVSLGFGAVGDNTMEIEFDSFTPVAGFQFDVTGTQLYNAAGGLAAEAGFTVSVGGNTVIGFSLQGATIQGSGILTNLEYAAVASQACIDNVVLSDPAGNAMDYEVGGCVELDFEEPIFGCTDSSACNYDADANVDDGSCFYETECWDGSSECDPNDCPEPPSETVSLGFGAVGDNTMEIEFDSFTPVAGFQFDVTGTQLYNAAGGLAAEAGFTVSVGGNTVIGFSLQGATIQGSGILTNLEYAAVASQACIDNVVLSDPAGNAMDYEVGGCVELDFEEPIFGCTDSSACNYDADANVDDGSCFYETECWDGSSECDPNDCPEPPSETVSLGFGAVGDNTMEIEFDSFTPVAGFQFDVTGTQLYNAAGGLAAEAGFTVSVGGNTVIGFSLQGATIQGSGILTNLEYAAVASQACIDNVVLSDPAGNAMDYEVGGCVELDFEEPIFGCTDSSACNYDADANVDDGSCFYETECWDGSSECDPNDCPEPPSETVSLGFGAVGDNTMEIEFDSFTPVAGFQFDVTGTQLYNAAGGLAAEAGFTVSVGGNTVIGFSLQGATIQGSGILTNLEYAAVASQACIDNVVLSDPAGNAMDYEVGGCVELDFEEPIFGCTDSSACNYDADANVDDGSCFYETECWDGSSECDPNDCPEPPSETVSLGFGAVGDNTMEIEFDSFTPVAGFQFDVTGTQLYNAAGGLAAEAGFTVSVGGNTVIGFSLQGATIQGSGILTNLEYAAVASQACIDNVVLSDPAGNAMDYEVGGCVELDFEEPIFGCTDSSACNYDADANVDDGSCFYETECWDGSSECDPNDCPEPPSETVSLGFGAVGDNTMEIEFDSFTPVAGFQFDVTGTQLYNAAGGLAAEAGFTVSVGGNTVIGFSLQGATIQGSGILTNLEYAAVASQACIDNVVLSDPAGNAMDYEVGGCVELDFEEPIFGCTDSSACNYDADANVDDGSCFYETECWDGSSECDPNDCPEPPSETVSLGFGAVGDNTMEIEFDSFTPVAGFQFDVTGTQLYNAAGGLAAEAGFTVSVGGNTVIGFSLQGATIQGSGILTNLEYAAVASQACIDNVVLSDPAGNAMDYEVGGCVELDFEEPIFGCTDSSACNYDADANVDDGSCFYETECWDGSSECDPNDCPEPPSETVSLGFGAVGDNTMEIEFDSFTPVAGFQFDVTGTQLYNAAGGLAAEAGFTVSVGGNTVIGFSLQGATIQGSGILTNLEYAAVASQACIDNVVLSDPAGNAMDYEVGGCVELDCQEDIDNDGICDFEDDCIGEFDDCGVCNGNNEDQDCNGDCFGDAVVDDCGVCDGNNEDQDCNGDCFGDAVIDDCGICDGNNADLDDCGVCFGDGTSCLDNILSFGNVNGDAIEISYSSSSEIAGFQFEISGVTLNEAYGGAAEDAGFTVSTGSNIVIGFSLEGNVIDAGSGILTVLSINIIDSEACLNNIIMSDTEGSLIPFEEGGCTLLECDDFDNDDICDFEDDCIGEFDDCGVCNGDSSSCQPEYFSDLPNSTGLNHLVIIEDIIGLEPGDEIGLFDANGLLSSEDCSDEYGELLVGAGVYDGSQMNIVGVGSLDFCDFPDGYQLSGWVEDNPIMIKIWDASQNYEYVATQYMFESGGVWNELFSTIMELDANIYGCTDPEALNYDEYATVDDESCIYTIVQEVELDGVILNNISLYVDPIDSNVEAIFEGNNIMFVTNDDGDYYIPENDVNTIGDWNSSKGYQVLLNGFEDEVFIGEGYPINVIENNISLQPFLLNNIAYLLDESSSVEAQLDGLPIVFVSDDQGHYYIPGNNVNTIDESGGMKPGKGYQVLISGSETIEFAYGEADGAGLGRNLAVVGASENYDITRTGVSHPMVINQITGTVSEGDELVAYANGIPVGVAPVDVDGSTLLVAWKSLYEYGLDTDGYQDGDDIEIRLFSQEYGQELRVMADLNVSTYGESPITMGSIHVLNELAVPVEFGLEQNYPNPFNPSTTIDVSVASDSYIMLNVYDINGRLISTLADDTFDTGYHSFVWNGLDQSGNKVSAGIYFYSLQTNEMTLTKKMILMK